MTLVPRRLGSESRAPGVTAPTFSSFHGRGRQGRNSQRMASGPADVMVSAGDTSCLRFPTFFFFFVFFFLYFFPSSNISFLPSFPSILSSFFINSCSHSIVFLSHFFIFFLYRITVFLLSFLP